MGNRGKHGLGSKVEQELVPGFKEKIPEKRFETAVELSTHQRAKDFVLEGQRPSESESSDGP